MQIQLGLKLLWANVWSQEKDVTEIGLRPVSQIELLQSASDCVQGRQSAGLQRDEERWTLFMMLTTLSSPSCCCCLHSPSEQTHTHTHTHTHITTSCSCSRCCFSSTKRSRFLASSARRCDTWRPTGVERDNNELLTSLHKELHNISLCYTHEQTQNSIDICLTLTHTNMPMRECQRQARPNTSKILLHFF